MGVGASIDKGAGVGERDDLDDAVESEDLFSMLDVDNSGSIELDEAVASLLSSACFSYEHASRMFREMDADGNGSISRDEFEVLNTRFADAIALASAPAERLRALEPLLTFDQAQIVAREPGQPLVSTSPALAALEAEVPDAAGEILVRVDGESLSVGTLMERVWLKWNDIGPALPSSGRELTNFELHEELRRHAIKRASAVRFGLDEFLRFGVRSLVVDSFIRVRVSDQEARYFRPAPDAFISVQERLRFSHDGLLTARQLGKRSKSACVVQASIVTPTARVATELRLRSCYAVPTVRLAVLGSDDDGGFSAEIVEHSTIGTLRVARDDAPGESIALAYERADYGRLQLSRGARTPVCAGSLRGVAAVLQPPCRLYDEGQPLLVVRRGRLHVATVDAADAAARPTSHALRVDGGVEATHLTPRSHCFNGFASLGDFRSAVAGFCKHLANTTSAIVDSITRVRLDTVRHTLDVGVDAPAGGPGAAQLRHVSTVRELAPPLLRADGWRHVLVCGGAGRGKTWAATQLAHELAQRCLTSARELPGLPAGAVYVPVLIQVQRLARMLTGRPPGAPLDASLLLQYFAREFGVRVPHRGAWLMMIAQALQMRSLIVVLDGVDEAAGRCEAICQLVIDVLVVDGLRGTPTRPCPRPDPRARPHPRLISTRARGRPLSPALAPISARRLFTHPERTRFHTSRPFRPAVSLDQSSAQAGQKASVRPTSRRRGLRCSLSVRSPRRSSSGR